MDILLQELYKSDLYIEKYVDRKAHISKASIDIVGIAKSGKTKLIKHYLLGVKKSSYLYIDCRDIRLDIGALNATLSRFITQNSIDILALDNYKKGIKIPPLSQIIVSGELESGIDFLETQYLYPLDYEEFLAYEHKYDSSALNHFFQLGGLPSMHKISSDEKNIYIQEFLRYTLDEMEFEILCICAKYISQKLSAFTIYERLKAQRRVSKDRLYKSFETLVQKRYIHLLEKFEHTRATKKIYLCDISLKSALSLEKNFGRLFENMIYLELLKSQRSSYYEDGVDFYLPAEGEIILSKPFADERGLFKKLESIEAFIFTHSIVKVTVVTMNKEGSVAHPLSKVEMIPFDIWALGD